MGYHALCGHYLLCASLCTYIFKQAVVRYNIKGIGDDEVAMHTPNAQSWWFATVTRVSGYISISTS